MYALLISGVVFVVLITVGIITEIGLGGLIFGGTAALILPQVIISFVLRKKVGKVQTELQDLLMNGQKLISRKVQQFQTKPGGNIKTLQRQIETDQKAVIKEALAFTSHLEPFKKWNILMGKQINSMRLQFFYQLKEFDKVDQLLASKNILTKPLMVEPLLIALKMARQYSNQDIAGAETTFNRHIKWFRGNKGKLLYGLMSWIYMEKGETEKARILLGKAKEITADATLTQNWENLSNCKESLFSNAGLGDEWYGLYLEEPPQPKQQKVRGNPYSGRRF
ncbi:MAG: hypothetical protein FJ220_04340 [Kiritimatiellaceae bacterium]|nr:hypothetical protein [Kiritimatiellaceae bacterium]